MYTSKIFQKLVILCYTGANYSVGGSSRLRWTSNSHLSLSWLFHDFWLLQCRGKKKSKSVSGSIYQTSTTLHSGWQGGKEGFWTLCCFQLYATSDSSINRLLGPVTVQILRPHLLEIPQRRARSKDFALITTETCVPGLEACSLEITSSPWIFIYVNWKVSRIII